MAFTQAESGNIAAGAGGLFGGIQDTFNAIVQGRMANLQQGEFRLNRGQLLKTAAVDKIFLIRQQVTRRGQQAASFAKAGVRIGEGSAINFLVQQAQNDRFNQARFDFNTATQARNLEIQEQQARYAKKVAKFNQYIGIAKTVVGAAQMGAGAAGGGGA